MFADPQKNIDQFGLMPGSHIADLGAGTGYYAVAAARAVGEKGRVYAVDVQNDLLEKLRKETQKLGLSNVEIVWGDAETLGGTKLAEMTLDGVIASNILFQIEDKKTFFEEIKRILKPGGRLYIIDWQESFGGMGPAAEAVVTKSAAREMAEGAHFVFERELRAGDHHYGLTFKKS
jgi:ubiquinone/menaquinone biosynthesis C-methylase UbiE